MNKMKIPFNGCAYHDDRMYILHLCQGTIDTTPDSDGLLWTQIHHENPPAESIWCLITLKNYGSYPISRVDHFHRKEDALAYMRMVEPEVPLISLGGRPPEVPMTSKAFTEWKKANGMEEYDYKKVFSAGGSNPTETVGHLAANFMGIR